MNDISEFLEFHFKKYNVPSYIESDPISIPHRFSKLEDIEITAFWTSMLAWGQRKTIINKSNELFKMMDDTPYEFIMNHQEQDLKPFLQFKHRTFQPTDTFFFIEALKNIYEQFSSMQEAFTVGMRPEDNNVKNALIHFHQLFFSLETAPGRTKKHLSTPANKSACKRLNMFLRWMVRKDEVGVDFGLWNDIKMHQLIIPLDVHVDRVARKLGLLTRKQKDWQAAVELTEKLKEFDPDDPVKFDYALFGDGVLNRKDWI